MWRVGVCRTGRHGGLDKFGRLMEGASVSFQDVEGRDQRLLTVVEAGRRLGAGRGLAYQMVRDGSLPAIRIGRKKFVSEAALERIIQGRDGG